MSNFYILDLENFATASRQCIGVINKFIDSKRMDGLRFSMEAFFIYPCVDSSLTADTSVFVISHFLIVIVI